MKASKLEEIEFAMIWAGREPISEGEIEEVLDRLFGEEGKDETDQESVQPSETE